MEGTAMPENRVMVDLCMNRQQVSSSKAIEVLK